MINDWEVMTMLGYGVYEDVHLGKREDGLRIDRFLRRPMGVRCFMVYLHVRLVFFGFFYFFLSFLRHRHGFIIFFIFFHIFSFLFCIHLASVRHLSCRTIFSFFLFCLLPLFCLLSSLLFFPSLPLCTSLLLFVL